MKYTNTQIEHMRHELALRDLEQCDDSTLIDIFKEGCIGWDNFSDEHVVTEYLEYFPDTTPEQMTSDGY